MLDCAADMASVSAVLSIGNAAPARSAARALSMVAMAWRAWISAVAWTLPRSSRTALPAASTTLVSES